MVYMDPTFRRAPTGAEAEAIRLSAVAARRSAGGETTLERAISGGAFPTALGVPGAVTPGAVRPEYYEQAVSEGGVTEAGLFGLIGPAVALASKVWPWVGGAIAGLGLGGMFGGDEAPGTELSPTGGMPAPLGGPGLKEPGSPYLIKEWHVTYPKGRIQYYLVQRMGLNGAISRYIMMYKTWDKTWKWWRWRAPHLAVIGKNMPSHKMITRLRRNLKRHKADARTITQLTDPVGYAKGLGYKKYKRGR